MEVLKFPIKILILFFCILNLNISSLKGPDKNLYFSVSIISNKL